MANLSLAPSNLLYTRLICCKRNVPHSKNQTKANTRIANKVFSFTMQFMRIFPIFTKVALKFFIKMMKKKSRTLRQNGWWCRERRDNCNWIYSWHLFGLKQFQWLCWWYVEGPICKVGEKMGQRTKRITKHINLKCTKFFFPFFASNSNRGINFYAK